MSAANYPLMVSRAQPAREETDVVRQNEDDDAVLSVAMLRLTHQMERFERALAEKQPDSSKNRVALIGAIVALVGLALGGGSYIVSISMYNANLAGEVKNLETKNEFMRNQVEALERRLQMQETYTQNTRERLAERGWLVERGK